jgi:myo-inositol-1(or 4)-monophosphatase
MIRDFDMNRHSAEERRDRAAALRAAVVAAQEAGAVMRKNLRSAKRIDAATQHDIKLELDVRCQRLIERRVRGAIPGTSVLGEEGVREEARAITRWVIDPIDGTVNFAYGVPHACVSIAFQRRVPGPVADEASAPADYRTEVGVVYDPFCDELWTAVRGGRSRLNQRPIRVSQRARMAETIVSIGFAKHAWSLRLMLPVFERLVPRVRKVRIMGSAALALTYVACGRMDAYVEPGVRLWDIAAGGLILECAGGDFWHEPVPGQAADTYRILAHNGHLRRALTPLAVGLRRQRGSRPGIAG